MQKQVTKPNVFIIGSGKLADAILAELSSFDANNESLGDVIAYPKEAALSANSILVHVGSGRQYEEALSQAAKHKCVFIQAATEKHVVMEVPTKGAMVYINAPNLDLRLIKLFHWLTLGAALFGQDNITLKESHQASKTSAPGTAYKMCDLLGIDRASVVSVRDPKIQQSLQIKMLQQHAYHQLVIGSENSQIKIETKIEGLSSYVEGLYKIIKAVSKLTLNNYEIEDLVVENLL